MTAMVFMLRSDTAGRLARTAGTAAASARGKGSTLFRWVGSRLRMLTAASSL